VPLLANGPCSRRPSSAIVPTAHSAEAGPHERRSSCHQHRDGSVLTLGLGAMEAIMNIEWRRDLEQVLRDAKAQRKPVLLDFSAAPM